MAAEKKEAAGKKAPAKKSAEKKSVAKKETFKKFKARVVGGSLNVRKEPEVKDGNIAMILPDGMEVEVIGSEGEWFQIKEGWIMARFVEEVKA